MDFKSVCLALTILINLLTTQGEGSELRVARIFATTVSLTRVVTSTTSTFVTCYSNFASLNMAGADFTICARRKRRSMKIRRLPDDFKFLNLESSMGSSKRRDPGTLRIFKQVTKASFTTLTTTLVLDNFASTVTVSINCIPVNGVPFIPCG